MIPEQLLNEVADILEDYEQHAPDVLHQWEREQYYKLQSE